jgi:uncharacterized membrane protein (UPF0127 family)
MVPVALLIRLVLGTFHAHRGLVNAMPPERRFVGGHDRWDDISVTRHPLIPALLALSIAAVLFASACGSDSPSPSNVPATASSTAPATATASSPAPATATAPPASVTATPSPEPVASTASIPTEDLPEARFFTDDGTEALLRIEVPQPNEYSIGLSGRYDLEANRGMLFYYPWGDHTGSFWMRNTHIDLDIAFVDIEHNVIAVLRMTADTENHHRPEQPYLAAIEAPAGWYEEHGIAEGAQVEFLFDLREHFLE